MSDRVTAETITDEQIRELRQDAIDVAKYATTALHTCHEGADCPERLNARRRIAAILNARTGGNDE